MDVATIGARRCGWLAAAMLVLSNIAIAAAADSLDQITVQAQRNREKLEHDVHAFVSSAIVQSHSDGSLERWTYVDVCPQVAGLNKAQGEFLLARLSQIARTAGVPLAGEKCKPNFFVFVTEEPEPLVKKITLAHGVFDGQRGPPLDQFVITPRPIRVWRNIGLTSIDGASHFKAHGEKDYNDEAPSNTMPSQYGSRLNVSTVTRDILSAIIVVDAAKVRDLNFGQLADYIGVVGFAQVDLDRDLMDAPTILNLFRAPATVRPQEMTAWDKALLHALYSTPQRNKMQLSEMQTVALQDITAKAQN
jgi:hypothetical protein